MFIINITKLFSYILCMLKAIKIRLYPTETQRITINKL